ncbi:AAA family ATPase [Streptomyces sp. NPDC005279]|uniref:AAA family ATPase n=1 Tax=Streptomyces sp. NPDC005279 TaxID=3364712 RepID=UPI0036A0E7C8
MELVGRGGELARLEELLVASRRGEGSAVLVSGSPGTGKSALLRDFTGRAEAAGALVLNACATPAESDLALGVAGQLLSGVEAGAGWSGPYDDGGDGGAYGRGGGDVPAVFHRALREVAATVPLVVAVDDVQYMDELSARCLLYLCGRFGTSPILLAMGGLPLSRSSRPAQPLVELLRHPRCLTVDLPVFGEDAVADFLRAPAAGGMDPGAALRLAPAWHRVTGGNPRLLRGLLDDHMDCAPLRPAGPVTGTAFRWAVTGCLHPAEAGEQAVARGLAVLGDAATVTLLARLLGLHEREVAAVLDSLGATGLLAAGRWRHEAARAAVLENLPAEEHARLHSRTARLLLEDGADPRTVARHVLAAGAAGIGSGAVPGGTGQDAGTAAGAGEPWAVAVLAEAAELAMRTGEARLAARFLRTAHPACTDERRRAGLLEALARAEWESDPAAVTRHLPALEGALRSRAFDTGRAAGPIGLLLWHGRPDEAARALSALGSAGPVRELRSWLGQVYPQSARAGGGDPGAAAERVLEGIAFDQAPPTIAAASLSALVYAGETQRAVHWCTMLLDAEAVPTTPVRRAVVAAAASVVHGRTGRYEEAAEYAGRALALLSPEAWGVGIGMPLSAAVAAAVCLGRYEEAARQLRVPVPEAMFRTRAGLHYLLARGRYQLAVGRLRAALGDFHACRDLLARWRLDLGGAVDWRAPAAQAERELGRGLAVQGAPEGPVAALSRAEFRVAALVAQGCTNRAIAARLYVTTSTVEQHLTNSYRKLSVRSRADLAALVTAGSV